MNGRRQLLGAVGLGSLLAGVTAVVPGERFAATAKPRPIRAANSAGATRGIQGFHRDSGGQR
jgi:hypothetical protein